jgi:hypothetical protein
VRKAAICQSAVMFLAMKTLSMTSFITQAEEAVEAAMAAMHRKAKT